MKKTDPRTLIFALLAVALSSALFRLLHVGEDFWLFGDQFDHWSIASRPWAQLPLHGTPRMDGGWSYGPVYYVVLWGLYHGSAWLAHPLPHYGGLGLGVLHVAAECTLLASMLRVGVALPWALLTSLLIASAPTEASLSHTLWNPNLSAVFFLLALAFLLRTQQSGGRRDTLCCVGACVLSVHCHTPALFFAAPIAAAACGMRWRAQRRAMVADALSVLALLVVLQLPYWLAMPHGTQPAGMDAALSAPWQTLQHVHGARASAFVASSVALLVMLPLPAWAALVVLLLAMAGLLRRASQGHGTAAALLGGIVLTTVGWALYQKNDLQPYWLCASMPGFAMALSVGVQAIARRDLSMCPAPRLGWALVAAVLVAMPVRYAASRQMDRLPAYRQLVQTACTAAAHHEPLPTLSAEQQRYQQQLVLLRAWCDDDA